jgi:hypothetical protein
MLRKKRRIFHAGRKDWDIFYAASKTHNTASMRNLPLVSSENIGRRREGKPSKSAASRRGLFVSTWISSFTLGSGYAGLGVAAVPSQPGIEETQAITGSSGTQSAEQVIDILRRH